MKVRSNVGTLAVPVEEAALLTRWVRGASKEPSCHAGGGLMRNRDWLDAERGFWLRGVSL